MARRAFASLRHVSKGIGHQESQLQFNGIDYGEYGMSTKGNAAAPLAKSPYFPGNLVIIIKLSSNVSRHAW